MKRITLPDHTGDLRCYQIAALQELLHAQNIGKSVAVGLRELLDAAIDDQRNRMVDQVRRDIAQMALDSLQKFGALPRTVVVGDNVLPHIDDETRALLEAIDLNLCATLTPGRRFEVMELAKPPGKKVAQWKTEQRGHRR